MNILQFLRIFWARRLLIATATISCVLGAVVVMLLLPPRWTGTARVILETLKPDPVTGLVLGRSASVYIATQTALVTDYSVAGRVVDQLGWLSNPVLIARYAARPASDTRDFRHWLAYNIVQRSSANVVQGTNILEIHYGSPSSDEAQRATEALRKAYIDANLQLQRDDANQNADWYVRQAETARVALVASQKAVADFERAHGIAMADATTDVDTTRLRALAGQGAPQPMPLPLPTASAAEMQLAQVNGELSESLKTLGPNHPDVLALRAKQAALADLVAHEQARRAAGIASARAETANSVEAAVQAQRSRVVQERTQIDELTRLQSMVSLNQAQFDKTQAKAVELRQQAAVTDAAITPLGAATVPPSPDFPNKPLILIGSLLLGLGLGGLVALLTELLAPRVRGIEDLQNGLGAPMLAVVSGPAIVRRRTTGRPRRPELPQPVRRKAL